MDAWWKRLAGSPGTRRTGGGRAGAAVAVAAAAGPPHGGFVVAGGFGVARFEDRKSGRRGGGDSLAEPPYKINGATVYITTDGRYIVSEPPLSREGEAMWGRLMDNLYYSYAYAGGGAGEDDAAGVVQAVKDGLEREALQTAVMDVYNREREAIEYYLVRDIAGYRQLDVLMRDPAIEDIICTRFDREAAVIHNRYHDAEMLRTNVRFSTGESFDSLLQIMAQRHGTAPTTSKPVVCCSTPGNDRVTITWGSEVSRPGSTLAVRKFPREPYTVTHLLEAGVLSYLMAAYVWIMNDARAFSFVVGETGSGKTTAINALACLMHPRWHVLTIEEVRELAIPHYWREHLVTRSSPHLAKSEYDVDMSVLGEAALRKKPHYVIVGEVRGAEIQQLFQIALTGHGCVSSVHAPDAADLMVRMGGDRMGVTPAQQSSITYLLNIRKVKIQSPAPSGASQDGGRRTTARRAVSLTEVVPGGGPRGTPSLREVFAYDPDTDGFEPRTINGVVSRSARLAGAVRFLGISDLERDISRRVSILKRCVDAGARTPTGVFETTSGYYGVSAPAAG